MCAIHGFCWLDTDRSINLMTAAATARGPDGYGSWGDDRITLGHNLLAVSDDVMASTQPWCHHGKVLVFNGEVYNYHDLRRELKHQCVTASDTEVLAAGLVEQGVEFLRKIDGMFSLAWYDPTVGELVLARDANGARPLYYGHFHGKLAFSSEIVSLLALGFDRRVSKEAFRHYYHAGLVAGPLTMFEGIRKLVPGEVVKINCEGGPRVTFNLNRAPAPYTGEFSDISALLRDNLRASVALTLPHERKFGLFLSGGMDSSAVMYEMCTGLRNRPRTFSTRFVLPHKRCNHNQDADLALTLSNLFKTKHREITIGEREWVDDFERAVLTMEEPRQGKSHSAYYACNRLLKELGVVVTLSGDGGDELLAGYKHHRLPSFISRLAGIRKSNRQLGDPGTHITLGEQADYLMSWLPIGGLTGDLVNDFMYAECLHTLSEDFLIRNDKLGGAFGMEARFPLLCRPFRDFARSLPGEVKTGTGWSAGSWAVNNKILLRLAYRHRLPEAITDKPKTGWRAPTDDWIVGIATRPAKEGPVREYIREVLKDQDVRTLFEITDDTIENNYLNNRHFEGKTKASGKSGVGPGMASQKELFSALTFAVWCRAFGMRLW
jgi:asparagine synthase (glutamine-hydrolysing)